MTDSADQTRGDETAPLRQSLVDSLKNRGQARSFQVEEAFLNVPRHIFVPETDIRTAYSDTFVVTKMLDGVPVSSCSQPGMTARMLDMLDLQPGQRVLEIGAGTGYAAALMAHIAGKTGQVFTVDLDEDIVQGAREHLAAAGISNVQVICADGGLGWPKDGPYDRIILTVGTAEIPPAFIQQLHPGGRIVIPLHLTSLRSDLAMPPDEILVALDHTGFYLESALILPSFFMGLRGTFAVTPRYPVSFDTSPNLSYISYQDIAPAPALAALTGSFQDENTGIYTSYYESRGLRLWLALRNPHYCELFMKENPLEKERFPVLFQQPNTFVATIGLYQDETWALLQFREETAPPQSQRPLRLSVRRFGRKQEVVQHLKEEIARWTDVNRPFVWSMAGTLENLHMYVCPPGMPSPASVQPILTLNRRSQIIFTDRELPQ